jgi:hypothetical protein
MRIVTLAAGETTTGAKTTTQIVGSTRENFTAIIRGTGTFSVDFEGSFDGTNWVALVTAKAADEIFSIAAVPYLRVNCQTMTAANITAKVGV